MKLLQWERINNGVMYQSGFVRKLSKRYLAVPLQKKRKKALFTRIGPYPALVMAIN
jgi:hypothetical protein